HERIFRPIEHDELVIGLGRHADEVVPQTDIEPELGSERDAVLYKCAHCRNEEMDRSIAQRDIERGTHARLKRRGVRVRERAGIVRERRYRGASEFATKLEDMITAQIRRRSDAAVVTTVRPCGKFAGPPK